MRTYLRHGPTQVRSSVALVGLALLLACGGGSCTRDVDSPRARAADGAVSAAQLRDCPRGDSVWSDALTAAAKAGSLDDFATLAAEVAAEHPDRWEPAWAHGEALFRQRTPAAKQAALTALREALRIAEAQGEEAGVARCANRVAWLLFETEQFTAAESLYVHALAAAGRSGRDDLTAFANNNLAGLLMQTGRFAEASQVLDSAISGLRKLGLESAARRAERNQGVLLINLGNLSAARDVLERAHAEALAAGDTRRIPTICVDLGVVYRLLGELDTARSWFGKVPPEAGRASAFARLGLGRTAMQANELDEAAENLALAAAQDAVPIVALLARAYLGEIDMRAGRLARARERLASVIEDADASGSTRPRYTSRTLYGKVLMLEEGGAAEAIGFFREAVELVESQARGLSPADEGLAYLRERAEPYAELAAAMVAAGTTDPSAVLYVAEQAHARALRRIAGSAPAVVASAAPLGTLQRSLAEDELVLDFLVGEDRGVVIAISRERVTAGLVPGWLELRGLLRSYRRALQRPLISAEARLAPERDLARELESGRTLRRLLFAPVAEQIDRAGRLLVVPDQDLALLPLAALPLDGNRADDAGPRFLGEVKEIAVLPMAGPAPSWAESRDPVLLAGDPLLDPGGEFAELPLAGEELRKLQRIWADRRTASLAREALAASRIAALDLAGFRTIHVATHAVASSVDPRRCAVVLSRGEKLGIREISALELGPALIVLSACRTGEGEVIPGEGVVGLSWAFLRAGAKGIAASLWSVEDESTAELMVAFHRHLKAGDDPVRAMARAQRELAKSRPHPAYWAPFVVILNPRTDG